MRRALTRFAQPLDAGGEPIIISIDQLDKLYQVIKLVSSTVSRIGSRSTGGSADPAQEIYESILDETGNMVGVYVPPMKNDKDGWY